MVFVFRCTAFRGRRYTLSIGPIHSPPNNSTVHATCLLIPHNAYIRLYLPINAKDLFSEFLPPREVKIKRTQKQTSLFFGTSARRVVGSITTRGYESELCKRSIVTPKAYSFVYYSLCGQPDCGFCHLYLNSCIGQLDCFSRDTA